MPQHSVFDMIKRFFPLGTRGIGGCARGDQRWKKCPLWPPDLFAISSSIVKHYDLYTLSACPDSGDIFTSEEIVEYMAIGFAYKQQPSYQIEIQPLWSQLVKEAKKTCLSHPYNKDQLRILAKYALSLLVISDEASEGLGFKWRGNDEKWLKGEASWVQAVYQSFYWGAKTITELQAHHNDDWLKDTPSGKQMCGGETATACILVPKGAACVQPKVKIPQVGCTLRSISHNLSLLPPSSIVKVTWNTLSDTHKKRNSLNILAVPFPFKIPGTSFDPTEMDKDGKYSNYNYFTITPSWLSENNGAVETALNSATFKKLISHLCEEAKVHVSNIDIVLFPEAAMNYSQYARINQMLSGQADILIAGVIDKNDVDILGATSPFSGNAALVSFTQNDGTGDPSNYSNRVFCQNKHHRWMLEKEQIKAYNLGDRLDPELKWWENIALRDRVVNFFSFNEDSCFSTLVCEDLARIEPCQDVVRSVGPNLLFALLMDGPQLRGRWSERYAMGLSDDPGTSVLTFTSLGLLRRSNFQFESENQVIGLWRDPSSGTRELTLPEGSKALLLTLNQNSRNQSTLDGRKSGEVKDVSWTLTGVTALGKNFTDRRDAFDE